ncbi:MAG: thioredoxin domain-containing protein [Polyangiaceae bacterium]|nr:thioredoxin domain-containing protein [Polyangiaceae bacterium]
MAARSNRLIAEASPYLLQHAHNPVDWYPWGEEALARAKAEDKPILLSIGYAACHWCHVMERESFENEEIAALMNERFVNVKVDREERPDLDQIYQLVVQLMGRSGGWPLTVFLTPDQRPFFAGTYFPPADKFGMPGFGKIVTAVHEAYKTRRGEVETQAQELAQEIGRIGRIPRASGEPDAGFLAQVADKLYKRTDEVNGGFGKRPKFPNTMNLDVLLVRGALEGDGKSRLAVKLALDKMAQGGIWDHLRGGFHRYSTDEKWLVPHFEKMLYDNALLLRLYVDGYRVFGAPEYAAVARELVTYLKAEMEAPEGGFYASQDADSEGQEGKFFVFSPAEVDEALGEKGARAEFVKAYFGVTPGGNFEHSGNTVLSRAKTVEQAAAAAGFAVEDGLVALAEAKQTMLAYREKRIRPFLDDKVLASWNGLMISALADAGRALNEPQWVEMAEKAFLRVEKHLIQQGRVGRFIKGDIVKGEIGFLDDQAYIANAAIDLFEATHQPRYLDIAGAVVDRMIEFHWDKVEGGFYYTPSDGERLITRTKDAFDQAAPSGLSMAALACVRLGELVDEKYKEAGETQAKRLAGAAIDNPFAFGKLVSVLDRLIRGTVDVVIVGRVDSPQTKALVDTAFQAYLPHRNVVVVDPENAELTRAPILTNGKPAQNEPVAYVCRGRTCSAPVRSAAELMDLLRSE